MNILLRCIAAIAITSGFAATAAATDLKVGLITSVSGPGSSIGIPYAKGVQAALAFKPEASGRKIQLITLDDASDLTAAARSARKLVEEDKVDALMGTAGAPSAMAIAGVGRESKTPLIALTPSPSRAPTAPGPWPWRSRRR